MAYRHCSSSYWTYQKISETMNSFVFQPSWWLQLQLQINMTKGDVIQNAFWVAVPLSFSLLTVVHRDKSLTCQASEFIEKKINYVFNNFSEALSCWKPSQSIVWLLEQGDVMSGTMSNPALTTQRHCPTSHSVKVRVWHIWQYLGQGIKDFVKYVKYNASVFFSAETGPRQISLIGREMYCQLCTI